MKHTVHKCDDSDCFICSGGLIYCEVCHLGESLLVSDECTGGITPLATNGLVAKYYKKDGKIVIYNSRSKLVEFSVDERSAWGLPELSKWKQRGFGCEINFHFEIATDNTTFAQQTRETMLAML